MWAALALATMLAWSPPQRALITYYCQAGVTRSGAITHPGTVAVDPQKIPLGSLLRIDRRVYRAEDTGAYVHGLHIDIFLRSCAEAIKRGVRHTNVQQYRGWE